MEFTVNPGNVNNVPAGTYLAREQEFVNYVFMIIKGHIALESGGCSITCGPGCFVGLNDLVKGEFSASVYVREDSSVFAFPVKNADGVLQIFKAKKDYAGIAVWTLARSISDYDRLERELAVKAEELSASVRSFHDEYIRTAKAAGFPDELGIAGRLESFERSEVSDPEALTYYQEMIKQPVDNCKTYFGDSPVMALRHVNEESVLMWEMQQRCKTVAQFLEEAVYVLVNNTKENLYMKCVELIRRQNSLGKDRSAAEQLLEKIKNSIIEAVIFFEQNMHYRLNVDMERMETAYMNALEGIETKEEAKSGPMDAEAVSILRKSLANGAKALTDFAGWERERAAEFVNDIESFVGTKNRMAVDENLRQLKRNISRSFFDLYMDVFLGQAGSPAVPQIVDLFLNYGFVDERLLNDEQLSDLCALKPDKPSAPCQVYTFREWLNLIYEMRRTPSRSELDMDFEDSLRDRKKRGEITETQMAAIAKDPVQWVSYEVHNMFTSNERLLNGQVTTFVPVMYEEALAGIPSRMKITKDRINTLIAMLTVNDPSVFHREIIYNNAEAKIEREPIMRRVYPEFILFPVNGSNILMWQETSSRKRDSAGRILVPMFFEGAPDDAMLRALGRFRWELCKTIMGLSWNNIQVKSLTSEYFDYVTYYRKNHDLSDEKKEKIKTQLTKARNNIREVFVQDYECWIKYEANGALRLNKVVRELFATYIPFPKNTRATVEQQPVFDDAFARFERNLKKKVYDLDLHYKNLEKAGAEITPELQITKEFYSNL
jgi:hypothetical protein